MKYLNPFRSSIRVVWYSRHELYHVLIGIVYAWFLREAWGVFQWHQVLWSIFGSLLPDVDHLIFFFFYGRNDAYSLKAKSLLKHGGLSQLIPFLAREHKHNTNLWSHNVFVISFLFDITEDLILLRALNPNWKRWGRRGLKLRSHIKG